MGSYLLYGSNLALYAFTTTLELDFQNPALGEKQSKILIFQPLVKTVVWAEFWVLLVKTSPEVCSISKTTPQMSKSWNFTQTEIIVLISANMIFNGSSFTKSETELHLWRRNKSRILFLSPSSPDAQNKITLIDNCHTSSWKMWLCANSTKPRHIICD